MNPLALRAFDLPDRLAPKADPALIAGDEQHFAAIAACLAQSIADLRARRWHRMRHRRSRVPAGAPRPVADPGAGEGARNRPGRPDDPETFGDGIEGAVDRYVAMTGQPSDWSSSPAPDTGPPACTGRMNSRFPPIATARNHHVQWGLTLPPLPRTVLVTSRVYRLTTCWAPTPPPRRRPQTVRSMLNRRGFISAGAAVAAGVAGPGFPGAGCSEGTSPTPTPWSSTVRWAAPLPAPRPTGAVLDSSARENPGLTVKSLINGDELGQVYETSRLARKEADVVMVNLYDKTLLDGSRRHGGLSTALSRRLGPAQADPARRARASGPTRRAGSAPSPTSRSQLARRLQPPRCWSAAGVERHPATGDALIAAARQVPREGHRPRHHRRQRLDRAEAPRPDHPVLPDRRRGRDALRAPATSAASGARAKASSTSSSLRDAGVFTDKAQGLTSDSMITQFNTGGRRHRVGGCPPLSPACPTQVASHYGRRRLATRRPALCMHHRPSCAPSP